MHNQSPEMKSSIEACLSCYQTCLVTASGHCLETGGEHVAPKHFRLMLVCTESATLFNTLVVLCT